MEATYRTEHGWISGLTVEVQNKHRVMVGDDEHVDLPYAGLLITDCCLNDLADLGKGYGKELYQNALSAYGALYSMFPISDDAIRVHESLLRSGVARREFVNDEWGIVALIKC